MILVALAKDLAVESSIILPASSAASPNDLKAAPPLANKGIKFVVSDAIASI